MTKAREDYDSSQHALNKWLKANPVGQPVNGGIEKKLKLDWKKNQTQIHDLKLFRDVDK